VTDPPYHHNSVSGGEHRLSTSGTRRFAAPRAFRCSGLSGGSPLFGDRLPPMQRRWLCPLLSLLGPHAGQQAVRWFFALSGLARLLAVRQIGRMRKRLEENSRGRILWD
jgi:hypothetical protein